jgi:hypothetical protein
LGDFESITVALKRTGFIVDCQWLIDPANDTWEDNAAGTGNSVLWIEP